MGINKKYKIRSGNFCIQLLFLIETLNLFYTLSFSPTYMMKN